MYYMYINYRYFTFVPILCLVADKYLCLCCHLHSKKFISVLSADVYTIVDH